MGPTYLYRSTQRTPLSLFLFIIEAEPDDPYQQIVVRVELPGGNSRQMQLAMHTFVSGEADKNSVVRKVSAFVPSPRVETGPYTSKRFSQKGIIITAAPFIVLRQGVKTLHQRHQRGNPEVNYPCTETLLLRVRRHCPLYVGPPFEPRANGAGSLPRSSGVDGPLPLDPPA